MEKTNGYIYVRYHNAYENACKLGKASNIPERDSQYATGELKRGFFKLVFRIQNENMGKIEVMLQEEFYNLNIRYDGGTEFYDKKITALIEPYFIEKEIEYLKLSEQEVEELVRPNRKKEEDTLIQQVEKLKITNYTPCDYPKDIIQKSEQPAKPKTFKNIVYKIIVVKRLYNILIPHRIKHFDELEKRFKKGQKKYAIEFMKNNPTTMIKQGDLLAYCDNRRNEDTNGKKPNFKDNSRAIEQLRKDILPNCWREKIINGELHFIYIPELRELVEEKIINNTKHKNQGFSKEIITTKLNESKYTCELTGLPVSEGSLAGDHWIPKEGGGISDTKNCVIINKILNEKKNKHPPVEWLCKTILTNFLKICKKTGMNMNEVKLKLITFIQEF
jgi:hypothetical protein